MFKRLIQRKVEEVAKAYIKEMSANYGKFLDIDVRIKIFDIINNESFLDEIVERINRKQLKKWISNKRRSNIKAMVNWFYNMVDWQNMTEEVMEETLRIKSITFDNHKMVNYWKEYGRLSPNADDSLMDLVVIFDIDNVEMTLTAKVKDINIKE